jgi:putative polyketide hydroxylase
MHSEQIPVFIVGGGLVGLSAALFLAHRQIPVTLIERHAGTSIHPRARGYHFRTMELFRELGLEEAVRKAGETLAPSRGMLRGETLVAALATAEKQPSALLQPAGSEQQEQVSPCTFSRCTQDLLEPILLAAARQAGANVRFGVELVSLEQDEQAVSVTIVDRASGTFSRLRADYLIAADGAQSPVRRCLGITMSGQGSLGHQLNILFEADLHSLVQGREFSLCQIHRSDMHGMFTAINNANRWVFHLSYSPELGEQPEEFSPERCQDLLRTALGLPEIPIEIKSILPWEAALRTADHFQQKRVFLAGDAAHQMPPTGGFGASTGIADAHNLAWKLAAVLRGEAAPALLETYETERRAVARLTSEQAGLRADRLSGVVREKCPAYLDDLVVVAGYQYRSPAIVAEDERQESQPGHLQLDGRPGTRAPHIRVELQRKRISTLDLFGQHFVLLYGSGNETVAEAAREVSLCAGINLKAYAIGPGGDLLDRERRWQEAYGITDEGMVLIRPDGFIAWRSQEQIPNPRQALQHVLARLLLRPRE